MVSIQHHRHLLGSDADMPPTTGGGRVDNPLTPRDQNFDSNMVIILAALLCALICALGLNSVIRCALRCGLFRLGLDGGAASTAGLNKAALRKIPVEEYSGVEAAECPICLAEFAEGEKVRVLPKCNHGFHVKCVDKWLASHSSCPTCRQQLLLLEQPNTSTSNDSTTINLEQGH